MAQEQNDDMTDERFDAMTEAEQLQWIHDNLTTDKQEARFIHSVMTGKIKGDVIGYDYNGGDVPEGEPE